MQPKTVSAILVWIAIALLISNGYFKSPWIVSAGITIVIISVAVYFWSRRRK